MRRRWIDVVILVVVFVIAPLALVPAIRGGASGKGAAAGPAKRVRSAMSSHGETRWMGDTVENVSDDKDYWGGYDLQAQYVTTRDLLFDGRNLDSAFYWPPGPGESRVAFETFLERRAEYPGVTLVPAGTTFKISIIQKRFSFEYTRLEIYGVFLDGALAGRGFSAFGISKWEKGLDEWGVFSPSGLVRRVGSLKEKE